MSLVVLDKILYYSQHLHFKIDDRQTDGQDLPIKYLCRRIKIYVQQYFVAGELNTLYVHKFTLYILIIFFVSRTSDVVGAEVNSEEGWNWSDMTPWDYTNWAPLGILFDKQVSLVISMMFLFAKEPYGGDCVFLGYPYHPEKWEAGVCSNFQSFFNCLCKI